MTIRKTTILVADDEPQILRLLVKSLRTQGYTIAEASNGEEVLDAMIAASPDLLVVDIMMPRMDGFEVIERVRAFSQIPIIILTARGQDQDKVRGLDLGADDYLTKPFNLDELAARVRAALRRSQQGTSTETSGQAVVIIGGLRVDFAAHHVSMHEQEIPLTPIEFRLLAMLARNPGRVLTQDMLLKDIWGPGYVGEIHLLQVGINRLRRKIEADPAHPRYILTRVGIGYLLASQESRIPSEAMP